MAKFKKVMDYIQDFQQCFRGHQEFSMRTTKTTHVISAHAEGEVVDVIVGGVLPPPSRTLWEQRNLPCRSIKRALFMVCDFIESCGCCFTYGTE